jgi:hypothetical protein
VAEYKTVMGFVQFDPNVREANGKQVQSVLIQNVSQNLDIRVSVWPEQFSGTLEKGDLVFAQGKYEEREIKGKLYRDVTASKFRLFKAETGEPVSIANALDAAPADALPESEPF